MRRPTRRPTKSELVTYDGTMYVNTIFTDDYRTHTCVSVEIENDYLCIVADRYDSHLMLDVGTIPYLIKALQKLQKQTKGIKNG
jgi:hypothetical protein